MFKVAGLVISLLLFPLTALAGDDEAWSAMERGDYVGAMKEWLPHAKSGDAVAQAQVALLYNQGLGVERDPATALEWYRKSARQGYADAQYAIGFFYLRGEVVMQDATEAFRWWRKAAEGGLPMAQYNLGMAIVNGDEKSSDLVQAYMWFDLASSGYQDLIDDGLDVEEYREQSIQMREKTGALLSADEKGRAQRRSKEFKQKKEREE